MEKSKSFEDVILWQKAHKFVLSIYKMTADFPKSELIEELKEVGKMLNSYMIAIKYY